MLQTFNVSIGVVNIDWTPNLHMALYEQITEVETCIQSINGRIFALLTQGI